MAAVATSEDLTRASIPPAIAAWLCDFAPCFSFAGGRAAALAAAALLDHCEITPLAYGRTLSALVALTYGAGAAALAAEAGTGERMRPAEAKLAMSATAVAAPVSRGPLPDATSSQKRGR